MLNTTSTYIFLDLIALIIKTKEMNFALCLLKYQAIMRMTVQSIRPLNSRPHTEEDYKSELNQIRQS